MYVASDYSNWDCVLNFVTYVHNTAVQTTTGFSPYLLLCGHESSCTLDTILPYCPVVDDSTTVSQATKCVKECHQIALSHTTADQQCQKHHRDSDGVSVKYIVQLLAPSSDR